MSNSRVKMRQQVTPFVLLALNQSCSSLVRLMHLTTLGSVGPLCSVRPKKRPMARTPPFKAPQMQPDLPTPMAMPEAMRMTSSETSSSKLERMISATASQQKKPLRYDSSASCWIFSKLMDFAFTFISFPSKKIRFCTLFLSAYMISQMHWEELSLSRFIEKNHKRHCTHSLFLFALSGPKKKRPEASERFSLKVKSKQYTLPYPVF